MTPFYSYSGPDKTDDLSDIQDISPSIESEQTQIEDESTSVKNELDSLKQDISNVDTQLNNKIDETIDTLEEQMGKELSKQERENISELLLKNSNKANSSKIFMDNFLSTLKDYGDEVTLEDIVDIVDIAIDTDEETEEITEGVEETTKVAEETTEGVEKTTEVAEEIIESSKEEQNLNNLNNALSGLDKNNPHYGDIVKGVNELLSGDFDKAKYDKIINSLKTDENVFQHIASDLQKTSPAKYEEFKSSLITISPSFRENFDKYESGLMDSQQRLVLGTDSTNGVDIGKSPLTTETDDGFDIEAGIDGRKLSINGGDYKLNSKIDNNGAIKNIISIEKKKSEQVKGLNDSLNSLASVLNYISEAISNDVDIEEVKQNIMVSNHDLYNELNIGSATSLEQIQQNISGEYEKIEQEKDKILKEKSIKIEAIIRKNSIDANDLDEKKKETLQFLDSIGFDEIPQSATNEIINAINKGNQKGVFGFKNDIDLANGNLGINLDGDINSFGEKEKKFFAEFMNVLLSGEKDKPISIDSMSLGIPIFKDSSGEAVNDKDAYIKKTMGFNPLGTMQMNIVSFMNK